MILLTVAISFLGLVIRLTCQDSWLPCDYCTQELEEGFPHPREAVKKKKNNLMSSNAFATTVKTTVRKGFWSGLLDEDI